MNNKATEAWRESDWCDEDSGEPAEDGCDPEHLEGSFRSGWGAALNTVLAMASELTSEEAEAVVVSVVERCRE